METITKISNTARNKDISIIILTYNAPKYVTETVETLHHITRREDLDRCEIIVWDNNSNDETKFLLKSLKDKGYIDKLHFSAENLLFAGGNNEATKLSDPSSKYFLLLNSDVRIVVPEWLTFLLKAVENGNFSGVSYGFCKRPNRCDGYCFLVKRELYERFQLDTAFQWWWGITKLQAQILHEGYSLLAYRYHNHILVHYGGKSGDAYKNAKGMDIDISDVIQWFQSSKGKIVSRTALKLGNLFNYVLKFK